jgi:DNA-binding NtrC family response regulator
MSTPLGQSTAPGLPTTADRGTAAPQLALVVAWSASQPERVGEVAFFPEGERLYIGRGDVETEKFACFLRQRPGETPAVDLHHVGLAGDSLSRRQLRVRSTGVALEIEQVGRCRTFFNGVEKPSATIGPGQTVMLRHEVVLLCVLRPRTIPALRGVRAMQPFGEADAHGIAGESPEAWELRDQLALAARTHDHVLLRGESGTGKELAAAALIAQSPRAAGPRVTHNASNFSPALVTSELFGNPANYPNPGMPARKGLVGAADRGTLFFDEIGDCPREVQAELLRVMELGEYNALGEATARHVDVRFVGATNRDDSVFRSDFLARFPERVPLPPLRQRREDIPLIVRHRVLERARRDSEEGKRFVQERPDGRLEPRVAARLVDYLVRQELPTNVRELHEFLARAIRASRGDRIELPDGIGSSTRPPPAARVEGPASGARATGLPGKERVSAVLERERWNVARAARVLGIGRSTIYELMQSYGIERPARE